jgi:DNA repair exonuclease SbcCD nuclease subunit
MEFSQAKVCCISDIHIGVHQNSAMWHDIVINWATWLHSELTNKGIRDIIIAGDFFHYRDEISVNTIHVASKVLDIWKDYNILVLVGNHDAYYKERADVNSLSLFKGYSNIQVVDELYIHKQFGRDFTFVPWATPVEQIPACDIIFGHFEIESFRMSTFKVCDTGVTASSLLEKAPLTITGHFHLRDERQYKAGKILYLGNPFQMDFGDRESTKGYYLLDMKTGEYVFHNNTISPEHKKLKLSELVAYGDITPAVKSIFKGNIVRLIFDRNISPDEVDTLLKVLLSLGSLMFTVDYENTFNSLNLLDVDKADFSGVDIVTAIKEFIQLLDIQDKADIIKRTLNIYNRCK